jgi:6-pyruvoyltetrahydropterin/6-carboxytetrahydropterin synthase
LVTVERDVEPQSGMAIDFSDLKRIVQKQVLQHVDHKCVNDVIDNPTAELMAVWCWRRLADELSGLVEVELHETSHCSVVYRGE